MCQDRPDRSRREKRSRVGIRSARRDRTSAASLLRRGECTSICVAFGGKKKKNDSDAHLFLPAFLFLFPVNGWWHKQNKTQYVSALRRLVHVLLRLLFFCFSMVIARVHHASGFARYHMFSSISFPTDSNGPEGLKRVSSASVNIGHRLIRF